MHDSRKVIDEGPGKAFLGQNNRVRLLSSWGRTLSLKQIAVHAPLAAHAPRS